MFSSKLCGQHTGEGSDPCSGHKHGWRKSTSVHEDSVSMAKASSGQANSAMTTLCRQESFDCEAGLFDRPRSQVQSFCPDQAAPSSWLEDAYEKLEGPDPSQAECRICKEEGVVGHGGEAGEALKGKCGDALQDETMLSPCQCGGSMAHVHRKCLRRWVEQRRMDTAEAALECEICKTKYRLRIHEELDLSWARLCSYASFSFYAEFCTVLLTLLSMAFLFFVFSRGESKEGRQAGFLAAVGMAAVVLGLGLLTLAKVVARWRQAISVPLLSPM